MVGSEPIGLFLLGSEVPGTKCARMHIRTLRSLGKAGAKVWGARSPKNLDFPFP